MIEATVKPLPAAAAGTTNYAIKVETPEKLALLAKTKDGSPGSESSESANSLGKNLDMETLDQLNKEMSRFLTEQKDTVFEYEIDKDTRKLVFRLKDKKSGEVIKQVPPEELLSFARRLIELLDGKIVNMQV